MKFINTSKILNEKITLNNNFNNDYYKKITDINLHNNLINITLKDNININRNDEILINNLFNNYIHNGTYKISKINKRIRWKMV